MATPPSALFRSNSVQLIKQLHALTVQCLALKLGFVEVKVGDDVVKQAPGNPQELDDLAESIDSIVPDELILGFLRREALWHHITEQDEHFMRHSLGEVFGSDINLPLFMTPIRVFYELKEGKHPSIEEAQWPVKQDDINWLWLVSRKLVRFAWKHVNAKGARNLIEAVNKDQQPHVRIEGLDMSKYNQWVADFEASLSK